MKKTPSNKNFILQKDTADCGIACLQNILRYNNADVSAERLRDISGTDANGTTMLGLRHAALQLGFEAQGVEANEVNALQSLEQPCILHIVTKEGRSHYIVYYKWNGKHFILGDPAKGIIQLTAQELGEVWQKKVVLLLTPTEKLEQLASRNVSRWSWFLPIVKKFLPAFTIIAVFGLVVAALNLSTAIFSQLLVDKLLPKEDLPKIIAGIAALTALLLLRAVLNYVRGLIVAQQSRKFNITLVSNFFSRLLQMPKSFFENRRTGDMVARLNDTNRIQQVISMIVGEVTIQALLMLVAATILFIYSWICGLIAVLFIPVIFALVKKYQPKIVAAQKEQMIAYARNESNYIDNIKGIGTIKLFNRENYFFGQAVNVFSGYQDALFGVNKTRSKFNIVIDLLAAVFFTALIITSVLLVFQKDLKTGELIAILQFGMVVMQAATAVALTNIQLQEAKVAFERMYEFINAETEATEASPFLSTETMELEKAKPLENAQAKPLENAQAKPLPLSFESFTVHNINFHFPGRRTLIQNASLEVKKGEIIAITGESGQGKSTLFQIFQKFYEPSGGSIGFNGVPLQHTDTNQWRKTIGVVTQEPALFSGTVLENILLDKCGDKEISDIVSFCIDTGLHDYMVRLPLGYYTPVGEGGINISGGQKQLICLARCLYHRPELLLLDEPTAAMDKTTEKFVINLLHKYSVGKGVILISHKDALLSLADKTYQLEKGQLHLLQDETSFGHHLQCEPGFTAAAPFRL
ncbi:MAG: peptidase domain-containing ABC transporter [Chitinophagaceae bacterium]